MIDIQFELLQIFPFSVKLSVLRSARCRTSGIFFKMLFADVKTSAIDILMTLFWLQIDNFPRGDKLCWNCL